MPTTTNDTDELLDTRQAAALLAISPTTLEIWRSRQAQHQPAYVKVGARSIRYSRAVLAEWIEARRQPQPTRATRRRARQ
jgi:predicted DNA-binding transcriptional regulator AlpA